MITRAEIVKLEGEIEEIEAKVQHLSNLLFSGISWLQYLVFLYELQNGIPHLVDIEDVTKHYQMLEKMKS